MGSQLQKEKSGHILRFEMVKMSERREIYTKYKKGVEQRKGRRGRGEKRVGNKEERGKKRLYNGKETLVNKIQDCSQRAPSS